MSSESSDAPAANAFKRDTTSKRTPLNDTALHVLKGAVVAVLGPQCNLTVDVQYVNSTKSELTVSYDGETLTADQLSSIERRANEYIAASLEVRCLSLPRSDAEACYTESPVNGQFIYDATQPQGDVLQIVEIDGCCVNCCAAQHVANTRDLRMLKIVGQKNRRKQKQYEFSVVVADAAEALHAKNVAAAQNTKKTAAAIEKTITSTATATTTTTAAAAAATGGDKAAAQPASKSKKAAAPEKPKQIPNAQPDAIQLFQQQLLNDLILPQLNSNSANPSSPTSLPSSFTLQLQTMLTMFANQSYTRGYTAGRRGKGETTIKQIL